MESTTQPVQDLALGLDILSPDLQTSILCVPSSSRAADKTICWLSPTIHSMSMAQEREETIVVDNFGFPYNVTSPSSSRYYIFPITLLPSHTDTFHGSNFLSFPKTKHHSPPSTVAPTHTDLKTNMSSKPWGNIPKVPLRDDTPSPEPGTTSITGKRQRTPPRARSPSPPHKGPVVEGDEPNEYAQKRHKSDESSSSAASGVGKDADKCMCSCHSVPAYP